MNFAAPHGGGGGHGGGGHGGGGGGGHHGGGGWGRRGWGSNIIYAGGYGYPYYYPPPEVLVVDTTPACPDTWAPVVAADGRIYRNGCVAQKNGQATVRAATNKDMAKQPVLSGPDVDSSGTMTKAWTMYIAFGLAAYGGYLFGHSRRCHRERR
jgi:hypothetical protein